MSTLNRIPYDDDAERDIELWVVNTKEWSLPVFLHHVLVQGRRAYRLRRALPMDVDQVTALETRLSGSAIGRGRNGWIIPVDTLDQLATKADGITPERYVRWNQAVAQDKILGPKDLLRKRTSPSDDFLAECNRRLSADPAILSMVWHVITQAIPEWLLSGRSLDLGYIKLSAVPYRKGWKRLLFARCPGLRNIYRSRDRRRLLRAMLDREHRMFTMTDMAGARRKRGHMLLDWTVEVTHSENWRDICVEREYEVSRRDPSGYVQRWAAIVDNLMDTIHEAAGEEAEEEARTAPRAEWDRRACGHRFVVGPATTLVDPLPASSHPDGPQSVDDIQVAEGKRAAMESTIAGLLSLPTVQPPAPDVRDAREGVRLDGDVRVLVPDAGCGEAGGQGLLDETDGPGRGMATRTETEGDQ